MTRSTSGWRKVKAGEYRRGPWVVLLDATHTLVAGNLRTWNIYHDLQASGEVIERRYTLRDAKAYVDDVIERGVQ